MNSEEMLQFSLDRLDDLKAKNVVVIDMEGRSSMTDYMVVCEGTSRQHIRSIAEHLKTEAKHSGLKVFGCEGQQQADWVLVDLGDIVVHIMLAETRSYYELEKLWAVDPELEQACG